MDKVTTEHNGKVYIKIGEMVDSRVITTKTYKAADGELLEEVEVQTNVGGNSKSVERKVKH